MIKCAQLSDISKHNIYIYILSLITSANPAHILYICVRLRVTARRNANGVSSAEPTRILAANPPPIVELLCLEKNQPAAVDEKCRKTWWFNHVEPCLTMFLLLCLVTVLLFAVMKF